MAFFDSIAAMESAMLRVLEAVKHFHPISTATSNPSSLHTGQLSHIFSAYGYIHPSTAPSSSHVPSTSGPADGFSATGSFATKHQEALRLGSAIPSINRHPPVSRTRSPIPPPNPLPYRTALQKPHPPPQPKSILLSEIQHHVFKKLSFIRNPPKSRTKSYYRCGDRGHIASRCRSSLVCFACGKVSHCSVTCTNNTLLARPLIYPMEQLNSRATMKFYSNKDTRSLHATLTRGVVLFDQQNRGAQFIQSHLKKRFTSYWPWIPHKLAPLFFLIDPPDDAWRSITLREKSISLGDVISRLNHTLSLDFLRVTNRCSFGLMFWASHKIYGA